MKKDRLQNEIKKLNMRTLFWIFCIQISLGIFSAADIGAQDNSVLDSIKFTNISENQSAAPGAAPDASPNAVIDNHPPDAQAIKTEERLKQKLDTLKSNKNNSAGSQNVPIDRQQSRAEKLRSHLSGEIDIWLRHDAGTPRQIKVKKTARKNGVVLERAKKGKAAGREQDEDTARDFLRSKRGLLRISNPDKELRLDRYTTDNLNYRHIRYNQTFKDIPVWPAELNVHLDENGNVNLMNGAFIPTPKRMVTKPVWDADDAIKIAREAVPEGKTAKANDPLLIIYAPEDKSCRLAWKIELSISIESNWLVIVDASNGSTLMAYNQVLSNSIPGSGTDLTGKNQQLNLWQEGSQYYMIDTSKGMYDDASDPPAIDKTRGAIIILDMAHNETPEQGGPFNASKVTSQNTNSGWLPDAVSLAYCISETSDYFLERHNRASIDGKNSSAIGLVRVGQNFANAFWSTEYNAVFFGDAKPYAGALDIVAHEFTHGVTSFTCNLIYQDQSGAMNEAFSDIFGEMVEARTTGSTDWIDGTLLNDNGRDLKNPASLEVMNGYNYPSKMSEFYGRSHPLLQQLVNQDYGGVHINATILSHCFYLLAEGLDSAIGLRDAEKIFYRAQTIHLLRSSQFIDARLACISSAEELFGDDSVQVQKVKEAFDTVEIFDNVSTPEPPPTQPVSGDDSSVFIYYDPYFASHFLARYEKDLDDPIMGNRISCYDIARSRPSVTGDGSLAFFVDSVNDACFLDTNPSMCESCLDLPGTISSVAMSPDGDVYSFVLLDEAGEPTNDITVVELGPGETTRTRTFPLVSPATEGESLNTVLYADTMDITSDNRYIVYDAYNILEFSDGTKLGVWSIYALDLVTEQIISLVEPYSDLDIGFPALSQTTNHIMTFDVVDYNTGKTNIVTYDFYNDLADVAGELSGSWSVPGYTGDDSAIVYSVPDASTVTGSSLVMQPLAQNAITPIGSPSLYISNADYGVVYRRGAFTAPKSKISVSPNTLSFGEVTLAEKQTQSITITNTGTGELMLEAVSLGGPNASQFNIVGGCTGQVLSASGSCQFKVEFLPTSAGAKSTTLTVRSNDPGTPEVTVNIAGTGTIVPSQSPNANAGADQSITEKALVTLDGTGSTDSDGTIAAYSWTQSDNTGVTVILSGASAIQPTFTAPDIDSVTTLIFTLTVTDNSGATSSPDSVKITINPQSTGDSDGGSGGGGGGCFIESLSE